MPRFSQKTCIAKAALTSSAKRGIPLHLQAMHGRATQAGKATGLDYPKEPRPLRDQIETMLP
jgi:hypothetical protein